jgi:hypothetical protein
MLNNTRRGSVIHLNGDIFYSPNSLRSVALPLVPFSDSQKVFGDPLSTRLSDFQRPRWWSEEFAWLAFVPLHPSFTGYPFDCLSYIPPRAENVGADRYQLNSEIANSWRILEDTLVQVTSYLTSKYQVKVIRPFSPWAYGYRGTYKNPRAVQRCAHSSRDWFAIWMGLFSYLIAVGNTKQHEVAPILAPEWFTLLTEIGFEQDWLSGIYLSTVGDFSVDIPRAGIFLDLFNPDKRQPSVAWFIHHNVPVWYPWGEKEAHSAARNPDFARHYAPSADALRPPSPLFLPSPLSTPPRPSSPQILLNEGETDVTKANLPTPQHQPSPHHLTETTYQSWREFFTLRSLRNAETEKSETPGQQQTRLNRMRKPPTVNTKVFIWTSSTNPNIPLDQLYRTRVSKRYNEDTIGDYGENQRRYDAFHNEWDLCEEFGPCDDDDDDDDLYDEVYDSRADFDGFSQSPKPIDMPHRGISPSPADFCDDAWVPNESSKIGLVKIFADHLGFVPPLKSSHETPVAEKDWDQCLRVAGLPKQPNNNLTPSFDHIIVSFINKLAEGRRPTEDEWDVDPRNRLAIIHSERFKHIHVVSSQVFIVEFPPSPESLSWKLAVRNAADALFICRLDAQLSKYQVALRLVEDGIPFRTLLPLRSVPSVPRSLSDVTILPIRLSGYRFTQRDYLAYEQHRASILSSTRGRAALLGGGITWRLAKDFLSADAVLQGPSPAATVHRSGFMVTTSHEDCELYDDDLSELDLDLICGVYRCFTGMCNL